MFAIFIAAFGAASSQSIYLCWKVAYVTYCVGFLISFSTPDGVFRSIKTYAQTYIELKNNIENKSDQEVTAYLMIKKFDQLNPRAQQLLMQQVRQIRGTVIPYVLQERPYGAGKLRLWGHVGVDESVYDLTYLLYLQTDKLASFVNIATGKLASQTEGGKTEEENDKLQEFVEAAAKKQKGFFENKLLTSIND